MSKLAAWLGVKPEQFSLLKVIYYAFAVSGILSAMLGVVLPLMLDSYNLNYAFRGTLLSVHQVGNWCALIVAGVLPHVLGRKRSTVLLSVGIVLGLALMAVTGLPGLLILAFILTGVGRGTMSTISNVVVSESSENKTKALNLLHASFSIGALLSPVLVILVSQTLNLGWRGAVWALVLLQLVALVLMGRSSLSSEKEPRQKQAEVKFWGSVDFWLNTSILFFYLCSEASIIGWLVTYFEDTGVMSTTLSQMTVSLLWVMVLVGRLACAACPPKVDRNLLLVVLGVAKIISFFVMIATQNQTVVLLGLLLMGVSMAGIYPTTLATMPKQFTSSTATTGTCIAGATIGAILMPLIVGLVAEKWGIAGGISTIAIALGVMVLLIVIKFLRSRNRALR